MGGEHPRVDLPTQLAQQPVAFGEHVVLVDRLEVLLTGGDEAAPSSWGKRLTTPATISRTQSSTNRGWAWAFSTTATSSERFISS